MGRIVAPWGIKGWVKVHAFTEDRIALLDHAVWGIRPRAGSSAPSGHWREHPVTSAREHGATLVAQLAGIGDRETAALLKGADVGVQRATLPARDEDELYYSDLVGLEVVNRQGVRLGLVSKVQDFGAHPVLSVVEEASEPTEASKAAVERMIPFVAAYVDGVDVAAGRIDVDWQPDY
ncbi:MAG TPA: ribosome maturation factor RimM [Casimicrobiaceae bacterium]|nr:ribosome maturation factor RimM [Casimicrobiaceae bacterium]